MRFCVSPEEKAILLGTPADELPRFVLAAYTRSAHGMNSSIADEFRVLLPRYLTLIAEGAWPSSDGPQDCLHRLREAQWRTSWPEPEVAALNGYFRALLETMLREDGVPGGASFTAYFEMIAGAGADMRTLLALWDAVDTPAAGLRVAELLEEKIFVRYEAWIGARWNPRWNIFGLGFLSDDEVDRQIEDWLVRSRTLGKLERAFFEVTACEDQERLSAAHLCLAELLSVRTGTNRQA